MDKSISIKALLVFFAILLGLGFVSGFIYLSSNIWGGYKQVLLQNGYNQGKDDTIATIIKNAKSSCKTMTLSVNDQKVGLINTQCLEKHLSNSRQGNSSEFSKSLSNNQISKDFKNKYTSSINGLKDCDSVFKGQEVTKCKQTYITNNADNLDKSICKNLDSKNQKFCEQFFIKKDKSQ